MSKTFTNEDGRWYEQAARHIRKRVQSKYYMETGIVDLNEGLEDSPVQITGNIRIRIL